VPSLLPSTGNLYSGSIPDSAVSNSNYPSSFYIPSLPNGSDRRSSSLSMHSNTTGTCGQTPNCPHPAPNDANPSHLFPSLAGSLPGEHNLLNMFPQYSSGANPTSGPQTQPSADHGIGMLPVPGSAPSSQTTFATWNTAAGAGSGMPSDFASMGHNMNQPRPSSLVTDFMFDLPDSRPSTGTSLPSPRSLIDMSQPPIDIYGYRRSDQMSQSASESEFSSSSSPAVSRGSFSAGGNPLLGVNNDVYAHQNVGVDGHMQRSDNSNPFAFDPSQQPNGRNEVVSNFGMLSLEEAMRNNNAAANNAPFSFQPPQLPGQPATDMGAWSRPGSQAGRPGTGNSSTSAPAATGLDNGAQYGHMSDSGPGLPAISPATEAREMREFWKNFMCDPYSTGDTPHSETPGAVRTPHGSRPAFMRGLSKSASLPPIRRQSFNTTNIGDRYAYDDSTPHASMAQQLGHAVNTAAPPKSLVNPADLRSYEEAIRARPPPVLKFDPRMGRPGAPGGDLSGGEQGFAHSDSSRRGSLAGISDASPIPSIRRIAPAPGSTATYSSSDENTSSSRPSFKRLASQTLGPAYSKKAAHHRLGSDQADSPSASSASDAQADDDDSESSGDDGRPGAPGAPRRHRGMRTGRRSNAGVGNMLAGGRMSIQVTGA